MLHVGDAPPDAPIFVSGLAFSPSGQQLCAVVGNERDGGKVLVIDAVRKTIASRSSVVFWGGADDALWTDESSLAIAGHSQPHSMQSFVIEFHVTPTSMQVRAETPVVWPDVANAEAFLPAMSARLTALDGKAVVATAIPIDPHAAPQSAPVLRARSGVELDETGALRVEGAARLEPIFEKTEDVVFARPALWTQARIMSVVVGRGGFERAELAIATITAR